MFSLSIDTRFGRKTGQWQHEQTQKKIDIVNDDDDDNDDYKQH